MQAGDGARGKSLRWMPVLAQAPKPDYRDLFSAPNQLGNLYPFLTRRYRVTTGMGIVRNFDRRREQRTVPELPLIVWGVDACGERFLKEAARARDVSLFGALLSGLDADLKPGDVIGILFGKNKARYRVVWIRYDGAGDKMLVALHRLESDACPWLDELAEGEATQASPSNDSVQP